MKRHTSLIPLSRDHHDGLVVAQELILGRSKAPRSTWPTDRRAQVDRVLEFFATALGKHFEAEEAHVFPVVVDRILHGAELVDELRADHAAMRARIRALERDPVSDLDARLPAFGERLRAHIRKEEEILFERMQDELPPDVLDAIGTALEAASPRSAEPTCRI